MRSRHPLGPIELQDGCGNDLSLIDARIDGIFSGPQRLFPNAAMARLHKASIFEFCAGGVFRRQADIGLNHRNLALFDDQHGNLLHSHQERIQVVGAVEQWVVLEADFPAFVEECLEVLVGLVLVILAAEDRLNQLRVGQAALAAFFGQPLQVLDILESAQSAGDVACRKRVAFERCHDADHVNQAPAFRSARLDARDLELALHQPEFFVGEPAALREPPELFEDRNAVDLALGDHQERHRMNRSQSAWRQDGPLNAFLAFDLAAVRPAHPADEEAEVGEVPERWGIDCRLGADGQRPANLRDHHANLSGLHLDPGMFGHRIEREETEAQAGHEEAGLIAGLSTKGDRVVARQLPAESLPNQPHLSRTDAVKRHPKNPKRSDYQHDG